jgi:glycosyltransferase involved in cell wall biosynthesis
VNSAVMSAGDVEKRVSGSGARRRKLLLIAAGCDPAAVGEGRIAFDWVSRIGLRHDVTLLTSRNSRRPPTALQLPGVRVIEWPDPPLFEKWERFNAMLKPGYVSFYIQARRWLRNRLESGESFDLIHQIMPLALRYPSPATGLGVPLVIGPRGGSIDNPTEFSADFGRVPWYTQLRKMDDWRLRHDPMLRRTYGSADRIIAVAPYVMSLLGNLPAHEVELMTETGVVSLPQARSSERRGPGRMQLLFVGRVIRSKGVRDAIRAMAQLSDLDRLHLDVVGDGDDMAACREETRKLGLTGRVTFHGMIPRSEVDAFYAKADVFVFPSFREPSGTVVVEAMSHGLAMIVADRGGPGFVVDESCGFRVPVLDPDQFASGIAAGIRKLAQEPRLIDAMGAAAREKIRREYLWDAKIDRLEEIYESVLAKSEARIPELV